MKRLRLPTIRKFAFYSLLMHAAAFSFILVSPKFYFRKSHTKVVWVELPRGASEEIDIKIKESESLPKTTIQEQKQLPAEGDVKAKEKPLAAPAETKPKQELRPIQPEPRPKHLKMAQPKKKADWQKALASLEKRKAAPPEAAQIKDKGEGFKYGTGSQPLLVPPDDPERIAYVSKLQRKIIDEWIIPPAYLQGPNPPKATLIVFINQEGGIMSMEWQTTSGNAAVDASCARAVQRASPLPIPPTRLEWEAYNEGYEIPCDPSLKSQM